MTPAPEPVVLSPMLARMPRPPCSWSRDCGTPATYEVMILWPEHQDCNLIALAKIHMRPLCDLHLTSEHEIHSTEADGAMMITRRLPS